MERPPLDIDISLSDFKDFYWTKDELVVFCRKNSLRTTGNKIELTTRIKNFLTGDKDEPNKPSVLGIRDSQGKLTPATLVINYKSDAATREFFTSHLGKRFKFKAAVLRWITEKQNQNISITYNDIIDLYRRIYDDEANGIKTTIESQFQYNQFMRDWKHARVTSAVHHTAQEAWTWLREQRGPFTVAHYLELTHQN